MSLDEVGDPAARDEFATLNLQVENIASHHLALRHLWHYICMLGAEQCGNRNHESCLKASSYPEAPFCTSYQQRQNRLL